MSCFSRWCLLAEQRFEIWAYIRCKGPNCHYKILLDKLGDFQPFRVPIGALALGTHCDDFRETCPECSEAYTFTKRNVQVSDAIDIGGISWIRPSEAFQRAVAGKRTGHV